MVKYSTEELLGVPPQVFSAMGRSMTHVEYMKVAVALLHLRKTETIDDHSTELWKYRQKAVEFYEERLKEFKNV